jgi:hypothetical protein
LAFGNRATTLSCLSLPAILRQPGGSCAYVRRVLKRTICSTVDSIDPLHASTGSCNGRHGRPDGCGIAGCSGGKEVGNEKVEGALDAALAVSQLADLCRRRNGIITDSKPSLAILL